MTALLAGVLLAAAPLNEQLDDPMRFEPPGWVKPDAGPLALPALPFTWEFPPNTVHEVPIDGTTLVNGIPVRLRYLLVKGSPEGIGRHFLESFKKQGLYVAPRQLITKLLTGVDPQAVITYSVVIQPNTAELTTVILGESRPLDRKAVVAGLPVPAGAGEPVPVQFEGNTVLSFRLAQAPAELQTFYARELPLRGWRPGAPGEWLKGDERLTVSVRGDAKDATVVLEVRRGR